MGLMSDFVKAGDVIKKDIELAATDAEKALAFVNAHKSTIIGLASLGGPLAGTITTNALNLYDTVADSVQAAGVAASANGVSVTLDQATLQSILADIAAVKGFKA
jgi:thiamine pyrophosphokinase